MKLLDKLDGLQFPRSMNSINGYVIVVDELFNDQETVNSAILGRAGVRVHWSEAAPRIEWGRQTDGTIHDAARAELLLQHVDFIVSMKKQGSMFLDSLGMIMNDDLKRITRGEASGLLWDNEPDAK
jgi:hypothetical protein